MTETEIQIPPAFQWLTVPLAAGLWPKGNEVGMKSIKEALLESVTRLRGLVGDVGTVAREVPGTFTGPASQQFGLFMQNLATGIDELARGGEQLAAFAGQTGLAIKTAKLTMLAQMSFTAEQIVEWAGTLWGLAAEPEIEAEGRLVMARIARQFARSVASGAISQGAINAGVQGIEILEGDRSKWDWSSFLESLGIGATSAVVSSLLHTGAGVLAPSVTDSVAGNVAVGAIDGVVNSEAVNAVLGAGQNPGFAAVASAFGGGLGARDSRAGGRHGGDLQVPDVHVPAPPDLGADGPPGPSGSHVPGMSADELSAYSYGGGKLPVLSRGTVVPGIYSESGDMLVEGNPHGPADTATWLGKRPVWGEGGPIVLLGGGAGGRAGAGSGIADYAQALAHRTGHVVIASKASVLQARDESDESWVDYFSGTLVADGKGGHELVSAGDDGWTAFKPDGTSHPVGSVLSRVMTSFGVDYKPPEDAPRTPVLWNRNVPALPRPATWHAVYPPVSAHAWKEAEGLVHVWDHHPLVIDTGLDATVQRHQRDQDIAAVAHVLAHGPGPASGAEPGENRRAAQGLARTLGGRRGTQPYGGLRGGAPSGSDGRSGADEGSASGAERAGTDYGPAIGLETEFRGSQVLLPPGEDTYGFDELVTRGDNLLKIVFDEAGGKPILEAVTTPARVVQGGRDDGRAEPSKVLNAVDDVANKLAQARSRATLTQIFPPGSYRVDETADDLRVLNNGPEKLVHLTVGAALAALAGSHGLMRHVAEKMRPDPPADVARTDLLAGLGYGQWAAGHYDEWLNDNPRYQSQSGPADRAELEGALALGFTQVAAVTWGPSSVQPKDRAAVVSRESLGAVRSGLGPVPRAFLEDQADALREHLTGAFSRLANPDHRTLDLSERIPGKQDPNQPFSAMDASRPTVGQYLDNLLLHDPERVIDQEEALGVRTNFTELDSNPAANGAARIFPPVIRVELRSYVPRDPTMAQIRGSFVVAAGKTLDAFNHARGLHGAPPFPGRRLEVATAAEPPATAAGPHTQPDISTAAEPPATTAELPATTAGATGSRGGQGSVAGTASASSQAARQPGGSLWSRLKPGPKKR